MNKKYLTIIIILFLSGIVWYSSAYIYHYMNAGTPKNIQSNEVGKIFHFSQEISDELKKIAAAHGQLDQMEIINNSYIQNPNKKEDVSTADTCILYRIGNNVMVEQDQMIRIQTPKQSVLIVPEEKMLVLQDPDQSIYQIWKELATKYYPDSISELYKSATIKSVDAGQKMISLKPELDEKVNQIDIYFNSTSHFITKVVQHISEYTDDGDLISYLKINETTYTPINGELYKEFFNFDNYFKKDKSGKLKGVAEWSSFDVYNSTKAELFKKLKK